MSLATTYADQQQQSISDDMTALHEGTEIEGQEPSEYLEEAALEVVCRVGHPFRVVLGIGGPNVFLEADLDADGERIGRAVLKVYWDEEALRYSSDINALADFWIERTVNI